MINLNRLDRSIAKIDDIIMNQVHDQLEHMICNMFDISSTDDLSEENLESLKQAVNESREEDYITCELRYMIDRLEEEYE
jgi:hypothetical protein